MRGLPSIDYVIRRDERGWMVSCPGRYRGFFVSEERAIDLATTLAQLDAGDGHEVRVLIQCCDGRVEQRWPEATWKQRPG